MASDIRFDSASKCLQLKSEEGALYPNCHLQTPKQFQNQNHFIEEKQVTVKHKFKQGMEKKKRRLSSAGDYRQRNESPIKRRNDSFRSVELDISESSLPFYISRLI